MAKKNKTLVVGSNRNSRASSGKNSNSKAINGIPKSKWPIKVVRWLRLLWSQSGDELRLYQADHLRARTMVMIQSDQFASTQTECLTCTTSAMHAFLNKPRHSSPTCTSSWESPATRKRKERRVRLSWLRKRGATFWSIANGSTKSSARAPGSSALISSTKTTSTMSHTTTFHTGVSVRKISTQRSKKLGNSCQPSAPKASRPRTSSWGSFRITICMWTGAWHAGTIARKSAFPGRSTSA